MRQRLVTIYLRDKFAVDFESDAGDVLPLFRASHGFVTRHLEEELKDGWRVAQLKTLGGGSRDELGGYLVVLLERPDEPPPAAGAA